MFNFKRISELEEEKLRLDLEVLKLKRELQIRDGKIAHVQNLINNNPPDCKPGQWCKACHMVRVFHIRDSVTEILEPVYICGKSEVCPNFVDKYKEENE